MYEVFIKKSPGKQFPFVIRSQNIKISYDCSPVLINYLNQYCKNYYIATSIKNRFPNGIIVLFEDKNTALKFKLEWTNNVLCK